MSVNSNSLRHSYSLRRRSTATPVDYLGWIQDGFEQFEAVAVDHRGDDDGGMYTETFLEVDGWEPIHGENGQNQGHAEMNGIDQIIQRLKEEYFENNPEEHSVDWDWVVAEFDRLNISLVGDKPCCLGCSAVLGQLDIEGVNGTCKYHQTMNGGGCWGLTNDVAEFLEHKFNNENDSFDASELVRNYDQWNF